MTKSGDDEPASPAKPARKRGLAIVWRLGRIGLLVYVGVLAVMYGYQTRLIFPGAASQGTAEAVVRPRRGSELLTLKTAAGDRVVALFGPALSADGSPRADAARCPTMLFLYGNGMCLSSCDDLFEMFRRLGVNVLIPEYVGYGMSGGSPSEAGCHATADAAYDHLRSRGDVDATRIVAAGWSLGGAVAVHLAARREVAGLAIFSTFTSVVEMARRAFPFLPASLLLRHRFESLGEIGKASCPVLIGHGSADSIVPHDMSLKLAAAAKGPVDRFTVEGADHNDFFDVGRADVATRLRTFLEPLR